ncbi:MAG: MBL fold metallo-hydrolase [Syntrophaceae bacterium]
MGLWDMAQRKIHHGQGRFINPFTPFERRRISVIEFLRWRLLADNPFQPDYANETVTPVSIDWKNVISRNSISITYLNHASVLVREKGVSLLVDPVLYGLSRAVKDFSPLAFTPEQMPLIDAVLITHGHYDHLDLRSLKAFHHRARILCPLGYGKLIRKNGARRVDELDWLDSVTIGPFEITFLPSNHWTMRNPVIGPNKALWGSYLIKTASGRTIYLSGDTAYFKGFAEIGQRYRIDLAIFNLGAYEPRWFMQDSHINPQETVQAFQELGAKKLMVVHWGTFRLGDEPVFQPPLDIRREMDKAGLAQKLIPLRHGQTFILE